MRDQQSTMVHGWISRVLVDNLPFFRTQVEVKSYGRRFGGLAVISDAVVVVGIVGSSGEIDFFIFLRTARGYTKARCARVIGYFRPFNFFWIAMFDLAHPAFIGSYVLRR